MLRAVCGVQRFKLELSIHRRNLLCMEGISADLGSFLKRGAQSPVSRGKGQRGLSREAPHIGGMHPKPVQRWAARPVEEVDRDTMRIVIPEVHLRQLRRYAVKSLQESSSQDIWKSAT